MTPNQFMWKIFPMRYVVAISIAVISIAIIVLRALFPGLRFDYISLILLLIFFAILLFPYMSDVIKRIREIEGGGIKLKLDPVKEVKKLNQETEEVINKLRDEGKSEYFKFPSIANTSPTAKRFLDVGETKAALLILSREIELRIRELARMNDMSMKHTLKKMLIGLVKLDILDQDVVSLFMHFQSVRNELIHNPAFDMREDELKKMIEIGLRLHHMIHHIPC